MKRMIEVDLPMAVPVNPRRLTRRNRRVIYRALSLLLGYASDSLTGSELMELVECRDKIKPIRRRKR